MGIGLALGWSLLRGHDRRLFLPGRTSDGHHQIELACDTCHGGPFGGQDALQASCERCHGAALAAAKDAHPKSKFTDPRNADRVAVLDAKRCTTCHREHQPERTLEMGVTLPRDFCHHCHADIATERPSHRGLPFDGCAQGGCHNFHDERALYEDFLVAHLDEPALAPEPAVPQTTPLPARGAPLEERDADAPRAEAAEGATAEAAALALDGWARSAHAAAGLNCSGCHDTTPWQRSPGPAVCQECHAGQVAGFLAGRHGMRIEAGLEPMRPAWARIPMKSDAAERALGCASCHDAHAPDLRRAAVEACLECHDDAHSRAYPASPHARLFAKERRGEAPRGSGVSCATCHLPRRHESGGVHVHHDQNDQLRPNEKMARSVCTTCHGLGFTLDALADAELVRRNFAGRPARHVESLDWVAARLASGRRPESKEESR